MHKLPNGKLMAGEDVSVQGDGQQGTHLNMKRWIFSQRRHGYAGNYGQAVDLGLLFRLAGR